MTCRFCRATNGDDDHRCHRCGRRLDAAARTYPVNTHATAPALRMEEHEAPQERVRERARPEVLAGGDPSGSAARPALQRSLFPRDLPRVVPFETIAPQPVRARNPRRSEAPRRARTPREIPGQSRLDFNPLPLPHASPCAGSELCDEPVATPTHRVMAAAFDASMIALGAGLFAAVFHIAGGEFILLKQTIPFFVAAAALIALLYRAMWCIANGDTAGMRAVRMRVVNFDGRPPTRRERFWRMGCGVLGLFAAGLGIAWALVDEESLTWHDHMSKTFPTPY